MEVEFKPLDKSSTSLTAYIAPELARIAKISIIVVVTRALFLKIKKPVPSATTASKIDTKTFMYRKAKMLYRNIEEINNAANNAKMTSKAIFKIRLLFFLEERDLFLAI